MNSPPAGTAVAVELPVNPPIDAVGLLASSFVVAVNPENPAKPVVKAGGAPPYPKRLGVASFFSAAAAG